MTSVLTNFLSQTARTNLNRSQSSLGQAIERLSSGLRINSAKDDAAGQAIANRFTANVRGLTQAARNANDGVSLAQTAEGALGEINDNLQRIRELTVQALNGTNSDTDLQAIQSEIQQRLDEIDRVSQQTQFNGLKVLSRDGGLDIQVGANDGQTISVALKQIDTAVLGLKQFNLQGPAAGEIDPSLVDASPTTQVSYSTRPIDFASIDHLLDQLEEGTPSHHHYDGNVYADAAGTLYVHILDDFGDQWLQIGFDSDGKYNSAMGAASPVVAPVAVTSAPAATYGIFPSETIYAYHGNSPDDPEYVIKDQDADGNDVYYSVSLLDSFDGNLTPTRGDQLPSGTAITQAPLSKLDAAIRQVDALRSDLGAVQNRFDSTVANLDNTVNNLSAARSRIEDADYATEVSDMTRQQILQQAGTAVLAQANQVPQAVLALLR